MAAASNLKSYALVAVQFACLIAIALTGSVIASNPILLMLEIAGFVLIGWAVWTMRVSRPHALPDVRAGATLVTVGPYAFIRHPMYSALLLIALALVLDYFTALRALLWLTLLINLVLKLTYEEALLTRRFAGYAAYVQHTRRIVPFVF